MINNEAKKLKLLIRIGLVGFIIGLALSGITAFAIETELNYLVYHSGSFSPTIANWISTVHKAVRTTNQHYPYLAYGTDWLAFGHLVIATVFIGPIINPVKNIWIFQFGMIACVMVFPLALIAGPIRQIPFYWRLIDCSFGLVGIVPLWICYRMTRRLEKIQGK